MFSVYQHWDKLKTCIVGKTYPPEFYSYITNARVRNVMERIAIETEEDYQKLIKLLENFDVNVLRPKLQDSIEYYKVLDKTENSFGNYSPPPMTPRDHGIMLGNKFYFNYFNHFDSYDEVINLIKQTNYTENSDILNSAMITRIGKDLYFGSFGDKNKDARVSELLISNNFLSDHRKHLINTQGHNDGCFCPVVPGLIISLYDIQNYKKTFPEWEVIYLPFQSWAKVNPFLHLKKKNAGKWWVPGEELNNDFTEFVEKWLNHWVGYVEETVFDVNMLVIDEKNVVCNNYNKKVFDAFKHYGITPHIVNFRHRYFWDGGLHCITQDLNREGEMKDYFSERGMESIRS